MCFGTSSMQMVHVNHKLVATMSNEVSLKTCTGKDFTEEKKLLSRDVE